MVALEIITISATTDYTFGTTTSVSISAGCSDLYNRKTVHQWFNETVYHFYCSTKDWCNDPWLNITNGKSVSGVLLSHKMNVADLQNGKIFCLQYSKTLNVMPGIV